MAELLDEVSQIESTTVAVQRTASTVKGGRRFSFGALVVVGDRRGKVGFGYGKSNEVPSAIEKAQKYARKAMVSVPMTGTTLPHEVQGEFRASKVRLIPAAPGTGVVAGASVRAVLEMAGITDCLTKCYGSTNAMNTIKAVFEGLEHLRTPEQIAELRGQVLGQTIIAQKIEKGKQFVSAVPQRKRVEAPRPERGGRGKPGGGRGGPGRGRGRRPDEPQAAPAAAPPGAGPAPEAGSAPQ
jgi:small subunit ribosomal protein S5